MADIGEVIKGLEQFKADFKPFCGNCADWARVDDALELLKEQEAVEPFHKCIGENFSLVEDIHFNYCPCCGKPITWAKQEG